MKRLLLAAGMLLNIVASYSQNLAPLEKGSSVTFSIRNFGFITEGSFSNVKGNIFFNPQKLENTGFDVSIDAATVNTKNKSRDAHLRKQEYFFIDKYPTINMVSTNIYKSNQEGYFVFEGNLIIKGITKHIRFGFKAQPQGAGYLFSGNFTLKRSDFFIGTNSLVLSDEVQVSLNILTYKN